ncbi:Uncharacterised protein [Bordetella pertussis]|nr:Uncharacterised protein [Bordetella pertussis]
MGRCPAAAQLGTPWRPYRPGRRRGNRRGHLRPLPFGGRRLARTVHRRRGGHTRATLRRQGRAGRSIRGAGRRQSPPQPGRAERQTGPGLQPGAHRGSRHGAGRRQRRQRIAAPEPVRGRVPAPAAGRPHRAAGYRQPCAARHPGVLEIPYAVRIPGLPAVEQRAQIHLGLLPHLAGMGIPDVAQSRPGLCRRARPDGAAGAPPARTRPAGQGEHHPGRPGARRAIPQGPGRIRHGARGRAASRGDTNRAAARGRGAASPLRREAGAAEDPHPRGGCGGRRTGADDFRRTRQARRRGRETDRRRPLLPPGAGLRRRHRAYRATARPGLPAAQAACRGAVRPGHGGGARAGLARPGRARHPDGALRRLQAPRRHPGTRSRRRTGLLSGATDRAGRRGRPGTVGRARHQWRERRRPAGPEHDGAHRRTTDRDAARLHRRDPPSRRRACGDSQGQHPRPAGKPAPVRAHRAGARRRRARRARRAGHAARPAPTPVRNAPELSRPKPLLRLPVFLRPDPLPAGPATADHRRQLFRDPADPRTDRARHGRPRIPQRRARPGAGAVADGCGAAGGRRAGAARGPGADRRTVGARHPRLRVVRTGNGRRPGGACAAGIPDSRDADGRERHARGRRRAHDVGGHGARRHRRRGDRIRQCGIPRQGRHPGCCGRRCPPDQRQRYRRRRAGAGHAGHTWRRHRDTGRPAGRRAGLPHGRAGQPGRQRALRCARPAGIAPRRAPERPRRCRGPVVHCRQTAGQRRRDAVGRPCPPGGGQGPAGRPV